MEIQHDGEAPEQVEITFYAEAQDGDFRRSSNAELTGDFQEDLVRLNVISNLWRHIGNCVITSHISQSRTLTFYDLSKVVDRMPVPKERDAVMKEITASFGERGEIPYVKALELFVNYFPDCFTPKEHRRK